MKNKLFHVEEKVRIYRDVKKNWTKLLKKQLISGLEAKAVHIVHISTLATFEIYIYIYSVYQKAKRNLAPDWTSNGLSHCAGMNRAGMNHCTGMNRAGLNHCAGMNLRRFEPRRNEPAPEWTCAGMNCAGMILRRNELRRNEPEPRNFSVKRKKSRSGPLCREKILNRLNWN